MYALADCNNFFVSCERVFRPDLRTTPVVVLSGNDGCVVSRSNEAKALGIQMGVPLFQIRDEVARYGIQCFSSNFSLYGDLSSRVMSILASHTSRLEQYSVDEAFMDMRLYAEPELKPICEGIVEEVLRGVGIPISIGIAPSKTLAKVASKYAKKYPGYKGACMIDSDAKRRKALADFPIGDVWGIGRRHRAQLEKMGVLTALDFADKGEVFVRNVMNKTGWQTWRELNGTDCINIAELPEKRSIMQSRTFAEPVSEQAPMEKYISDFASRCAEKLRGQHSVCRQAVVFAETSRFRTDLPQKIIYQCVSFPVATNLTSEILEYILRAFRRDYRPGYPFKRAGVILMSISPDSSVQQNLFDARDRARDARLQKALDGLNAHYGRKAVVTGIQVGNAATDALIRQEHMSPCYSTNIRDIITLKC